jgi:DNA-binding PadR family transcriptional regulator
MMKAISRAEKTIMITILKLGDSAYGVSIREQIQKDTVEKWSFASIYTPLDKLKRKGLVKKTRGESLPVRGEKASTITM